MSDILREALVYVDPNASKEEVPDPKAKGKKPSDEKPDPFAGQDTTVYKEIATALLEQIQIITNDKESLPGKDIDLISMVTDDSLLANLFCQKLKFTLLDKPKSTEEKETQLREIIQKEKELVDQLEEDRSGSAEDKKGKKGGGGAKSPEDV